MDIAAVCDACRIGKDKKITSHKKIDSENYKKGQCWSVDFTGRKDTPSIDDKAVMGAVFVEHTTKFSVTYTIENNDEANVLKILKDWSDEYLSLVKSWYAESAPDLVYFLASDNLEMAYHNVQRYLRTIGVKSKFTDPNKSSSNGIVERMIGTLDRIQRVLRIQRTLPDEFWGPAFHHANFLRVRMPYTFQGKSRLDPHTQFYGQTFDYSKLRIFGSTCWATIKDPLKSTPERAEQGIFVGFKPNSNTYLVYIPSQNKIVPSGDVRFDEDRVESLEPSFSIADESNSHDNPDNTSMNRKADKYFSEDISSLSNDAFILAARRNLQNFQPGSEVTRR
jgi:hypothetical protein